MLRWSRAKPGNSLWHPFPREAIADVHGEKDLIEMLRRELGWPIPANLERLADITIPHDVEQDCGLSPKQGCITASRLLKPSGDHPWGVYLFAFREHLPPPAQLRRLLRTLGSLDACCKDTTIWDGNDLVVICTADWKRFQFLHIAGQEPGHAVVSSFGWAGPQDPFLSTLCKHNLSRLRMHRLEPNGGYQPHDRWGAWREAFSAKAITDEFYGALMAVFNALRAGTMGLQGQDRRRFAELLVNRMVFLKFVEKKGWLDGDQAYLFNRYQAYGSRDYWRDFLCDFFFEGLGKEREKREPRVNQLLGEVPFLDAEFFAPSAQWDDRSVSMENGVFAFMFDNLLNPYDFSVSGTGLLDGDVSFNQDLLGYGYEKFIADRHGRGAYYTHPAEVNLMCRESLRAYLGTSCREVDKDLIDRLVYAEMSRTDFMVEQDALALYRALCKVTVLDPALGSGTFPVAMMKHLSAALQTLGAYLKNSRDFEKLLEQESLPDPTDALAVKVHIMERNIYGCDIDPVAVQIARLRLWIELMVDCDTPEALPHCRCRFVVGDALISGAGTDSEGNLVILEALLGHPTKTNPGGHDIPEASGKAVARLARLRRDQFRERDDGKRQWLADRIAQTRNKLLRSFGVRAGYGKGTEKHVLWQLDFAEIFSGEEPGFDIAITNPPYVRQELIDRAYHEFQIPMTKETLRTFYRDALNITIDGKADLYVYFFFRSMMLLKPNGGVCTFICSTSWLDDEFGFALQRFIAERCSAVTVIENQYSRAFQTADNNAAVTLFVLGRDFDREGSFRFIALRAPERSPQRIPAWNTTEQEEPAASRIRRVERSRLFPVRQGSSRESGTGKWGTRFLRMPDSLEAMLDSARPYFEYLGDLCVLEYGTKPGLVEFFIIDRPTINKFGIEDEFCIRILTSTREIDTPVVRADVAGRYAFVCHWAREDLVRKGCHGALRYIEWGEVQISRKGASHTVAGVPWPAVKSVAGNKPEWYSLKLKKPGHFIVPALIRERFCYACNPADLPATNMFYHGRFFQHVNMELQCALLNSSLTYLATEVYGRINIGGRLNLYGTEYRQLPVLSYRAGKDKEADAVIAAFQKVAGRPVRPILDEIRTHDRREFDEAVFRFLGLAGQEALDAMYCDLETLVSARLSRETSR